MPYFKDYHGRHNHNSKHSRVYITSQDAERTCCFIPSHSSTHQATGLQHHDHIIETTLHLQHHEHTLRTRRPQSSEQSSPPKLPGLHHPSSAKSTAVRNVRGICGRCLQATSNMPRHRLGRSHPSLWPTPYQIRSINDYSQQRVGGDCFPQEVSQSNASVYRQTSS
jgi:hypothetical protein